MLLGNGGEGERVGENLIAVLDSGSFQSKKDRAAAGVHRDGIIMPNKRAEFVLQQGNLTRGLVGQRFPIGGRVEFAVEVVAVQATGSHQLDCLLDALFRNDFGAFWVFRKNKFCNCLVGNVLAHVVPRVQMKSMMRSNLVHEIDSTAD